jgi:hypothetical protein
MKEFEHEAILVSGSGAGKGEACPFTSENYEPNHGYDCYL